MLCQPSAGKPLESDAGLQPTECKTVRARRVLASPLNGSLFLVRNDYCREKSEALSLGSIRGRVRSEMVRNKSSQKLFTEDEVVNLTGICLEHVRSLARNRHLGTLARTAEAAGAAAERWLFTNSDLMILAVLHPRCEHYSRPC